jgi:hypothetical protein
MDNRTSYAHMLKVFACGVWYSLPNPHEHETRKLFGLNLGFSVLKMGYVILDMESRNIVDSRDVHFIESFLPFKSWNSPSKIVLTCDNWPKSTPEEKTSMKMEDLLVRQHNVLDDVQSGGDSSLSPAILKNSVLSDPELPGSSDPILDSVPYEPSPVQQDLLSPIPLELQSPLTPIENDGLSPTQVLSKTDSGGDGSSPTLVMSKNKNKKKISDTVSITDLGADDSFKDTLLDGFIPTDQTSNDPSMIFSSPPNSVNPHDPLNISNTPSKEKEIDKRRFETFKINGKNAEAGLPPRPTKSKKILSRNQKFRNSRYRYLDLGDKIPVPKDLLNPFGSGPYFEVEDITDIKDSTMQSNIGYDLKVKWKLMPGETVNQETWEPVENLQDCKDLMRKFKGSKPFIDYMEYKRLGNVYAKPKVSKKSRSYKGVDIQTRRQTKNLKELRSAQAFDDYTSRKTSSPDIAEPASKSLNLRRSSRLQANTASDLPSFDTTYFGSVPGYVDESEKTRIDEIFQNLKNFSSQELYEDDTSLEIPSIEQVLHQALVNEEYRGSEELPKPPSYEDHPHRTPGNKELNQQILRSIDKVLAEVGIDEDAPKTRSAMLKTKYDAEFIEAELSELDSIDKHGTFEEVELPEGAVPITCR